MARRDRPEPGSSQLPAKRLKTKTEDGSSRMRAVASTSQASTDPYNATMSRDTMLDSGIDYDINWAGRVERMQLVNFMCHSNLELNFNPRINFVSGRNGSGKSAIMNALVIVLGGTANNTGRAAGVTDLIKKGETSGRVTIVLINEGFNPYKADIYGDRIVIIRNFSKSSGSGYIIKSASGTVISKKKEEIDNIRGQLQLLIKNPICVLNQDVARTFLSSNDSTVRFNLFMEATQLATLLEHYTTAAINFDISDKDIAKKSALLCDAEKEIGELKRVLEKILALETHIRERNQLENEFVWAGVVADEKALEALKGEIATVEGKVAQIESAASNHQTILTELEGKIEELKEELQTVVGQKRGIAEGKRVVYAEVMTQEREVATLERKISVIEPKLNRTRLDVRRVKEHIEQNDESANRTAAESARCQQRMQELQGELREIIDRLTQAQRDLDNGNETRMQKNEELQNVVRLIQDMTRSKEHKQRQLEGMRGRSDVEILRYGNYVPELIAAIDSAEKKRMFRKRPIGPLGIHVKLNCDPKWAPAIESVIGSLMMTFCCDNGEDFKVLSNIMDKVIKQRHPSVIISRFLNGRHNLGNRRVRVPGYNTILDTLTFTNDTVFNTFIDQAGIEKILLFDNNAQAAAMLSFVENVPKGLQLAYTLTGDKYKPAPNYCFYGGRLQPPRFFDNATKREDVIKKLEGEIRKAESEIAEQVSQQNTLSSAMRKLKDFAQRSDSRFRELREKRLSVERELNELRDQEQSRPVPRTKTALEEELRTLQQQEADCHQQLTEAQTALDAVQKRKLESSAKLDKANRELENIQDAITRLEHNIEKTNSSVQTHNARRRNADAQIRNLSSQAQKMKEQEAEAIVELESRIASATECCERIDTNRSAAEVQAALSKVERYLSAAEKNTGSREDKIAEYRLKKECYDKLLKWHRNMSEMILDYKKALKLRRDLYNVKRKHIARTVASVFRAMLLTRGYEGSLEFHFLENRLDLEVHPNQNALDSRKDSKTLSGGERSYSTVSFILAIWRTVRMPFYFLDEFDVFMDKVNRKMTMDLLLEYAKESAGRQYVFITPQDISNVVASDIINIYKMADPERKRLSN